MTDLTVDLSDVSVMLAMPVHRDVPISTVSSLLATQDLMRASNIPLEISFQIGSSIIEAARSRAVHTFLKSDKNRLFFVDSDMVWDAKEFLKLVALSTKLEIVGGGYPAKCDDIKFFLSVESLERLELNSFGCIDLKGMGLGFSVFQRKVIEELAEQAPKLKFPDLEEPIAHLFRCDTNGGHFRGEDMAFFSDIRALGYGVNLDPSITLGHTGAKTWTAKLSDMLQQRD